MIKLNIFAIVISVLLAGIANAAEIYNKDGNKLDLYGEVNVNHFFGKNDNNNKIDDSNVHIGIKSNTKISDQLIGFSNFELENKTNKSKLEHQNINSLSYIGVKIADFGSLDYGHNYNILYDINSWVNITPIYAIKSISNVNNYLINRNYNLLTYRNTDFFGMIDGLNFAIQYQIKNIEIDKISNKTIFNNKNSFGLSANYNIGWGITLGAGYSKFNSIFDNQQKDINNHISNNNDEGWNVGIKYDANNLYLAAIYSKFNNVIKSDNVEDLMNNDSAYIVNKTKDFKLVGQYLFNEIGLKPSIIYVQSKGKDLTATSYLHKQNLIKYISLGASYYFNKNIIAVVDYKINLINNNDNFNNKYDIIKDNLINLGLVYKF
ncbi:MAG: porin OmpF [Arsenophonus endosymbiont of Ceratovacuna japonica]